MPLNKDRRAATLDRKRNEYLDCVERYIGNKINEKGDYEKVDNAIFHQIKIDVPRTDPLVPLFVNPIIHEVSFSFPSSLFFFHFEIYLLILKKVIRKNIIRLDNQTPCKWICPRN